MLNQWKKWLLIYKKVTIPLEDLEQFAIKQGEDYEQFSKHILQLEQDGVLQMVKAQGRTSRTPSLAYRYRIQKYVLTNNYHQLLQSYRHQLHPQINLDAYYSLDPSIFQQDLPYLLKIHEYLMMHGLPEEEVPSPERSFELVNDEKWIEKGDGKELLERTGLWKAFRIFPVSDPLMFAINPGKINESMQLHLIVENKTTYQALVPVVAASSFATLIYGCGNKIVKSIEQFSLQYPVQANHYFLYFGDLDRSGISIWHSLAKGIMVDPALPFYRACFRKNEAKGKDYQRKNDEAFAHFCTYFTLEEQQKMKIMLENGYYYPQEVLNTKELQHIGRETDWNAFIELML